MGSVRTPILGRPRPLSGDRRAAPCYTLNCEEPRIRWNRLIRVLRDRVAELRTVYLPRIRQPAPPL
jgi:hypothetical protein